MKNTGIGLYHSFDRAGIRSFWKHLNLNGNGENLDISLEISDRLTELKGSLSIPDYLITSQNFNLSLNLIKERTKAYIAKNLELKSKFEKYLIHNSLSTSLGILFEENQSFGFGCLYSKNFSWGFPTIEVKFDTTDNLMDPISGFRSNISIIYYNNIYEKPRINFNNKNSIFTKSYSSFYFPLFYTNKLNNILLGFWSKSGNILSKNVRDIPANKRFYRGGIGSIKSYAFQRMSDMDIHGIPIGNTSFTELGLEARIRINEWWGWTIFFEVGAINNINNFYGKDKIFYGAGFGIRYYTFIGPLRFDIAIPLNNKRRLGRGTVDNPFQSYISMGQSF